MKKLIKLFAAAVIMLSCAQIGTAQNSGSEKKAAKVAEVKKMVDNGSFIFEATYAIPMRGESKLLTSTYDLKITKDSVTAFLPYFGRAYLAPSPTETDGGIKFTSTNFNYTNVLHKNCTWDIVIKPKDHSIIDWRDVQQLRLSISPDGYASLQVTSSNRDPISFDGDIVGRD
jgi:hypothetical protein